MCSTRVNTFHVCLLQLTECIHTSNVNYQLACVQFDIAAWSSRLMIGTRSQRRHKYEHRAHLNTMLGSLSRISPQCASACVHCRANETIIFIYFSIMREPTTTTTTTFRYSEASSPSYAYIRTDVLRTVHKRPRGRRQPSVTCLPFNIRTTVTGAGTAYV